MAYTTIDNPFKHFNTVTYTGASNSAPSSVTGVGFQPDWIWIKNETDTTNHNLYDSVRGGNGTSHYWLKSNSNVAEGTNTSSLLTIGSDGFTLGDGNEVNGNSDNIVSWNWKAGTSFSNDASATGVGTIDSTGSINTTAGFSIISYTGTGSNGTIAHGLGAVPRWIIVKVRDTSNNWIVQHGSLGATKRMLLDATSAEASASTFFNNTDPTSSVFSVGTEDVTNNSGNAYIAYCFAEKQGYSKFGSYTGNGNADGTFVYTGFKPAWIMNKRTDTTNNWIMQDNKRNGFNADNPILKANLTDAEQAVHEMDFVSNGFKVRTTGAGSNASGGTYIYMAFAEAPFVTAGTKAAGTAR